MPAIKQKQPLVQSPAHSQNNPIKVLFLMPTQMCMAPRHGGVGGCRWEGCLISVSATRDFGCVSFVVSPATLSTLGETFPPPKNGGTITWERLWCRDSSSLRQRWKLTLSPGWKMQQDEDVTARCSGRWAVKWWRRRTRRLELNESVRVCACVCSLSPACMRAHRVLAGVCECAPRKTSFIFEQGKHSPYSLLL